MNYVKVMYSIRSYVKINGIIDICISLFNNNLSKGVQCREIFYPDCIY